MEGERKRWMNKLLRMSLLMRTVSTANTNPKLYQLYNWCCKTSLHCLPYKANSYRKDTFLKILMKTLSWSIVFAKPNTTSPEKKALMSVYRRSNCTEVIRMSYQLPRTAFTNPDFTWLLLVFSKGGAGSWCSGEEAELLSLSLPSLRLTLWKNGAKRLHLQTKGC